jgi:hypothetical protein
MSDRILFSPVGSRDPFSGGDDGALVHIVRHYRPDVVVLYLSAEMANNEAKDQRYSRAAQSLNPKVSVRKIESAVPDIHRSDVLIPEFRSILTELSSKYPQAELLLNTTSGTPAMQAALIALNAFGLPPTQAIQVADPLYVSSENRCLPVTSAALGVLLQRENLRRLVENYEYEGARSLASAACIPESARLLVIGAAERRRLDLKGAQPRFQGSPFTVDPRKDLSEAVSALEVLRKKGTWLDFARSITPIVDDLVNKRLGVPRRDLPREFPSRFGMLDERTRKEWQPFLDFHQRVRNNAAHELVTLDDKRIKDQCGHSPTKLLSLLAEATRADLTLYDQINAEIVSQVDGAPLHL